MEKTLQILICAIDGDIRHISNVILPEMEGVGYVVSIQYTNESYIEDIPSSLHSRNDVKVSCMGGRGLSRNRNNALSHADADILLIADADNRYTAKSIDIIRLSFESHPHYDIICFAAKSYDGSPIKQYPKTVMDYRNACKFGYYPSSFEIAIRNNVGVRFDERFGLGSQRLCAGEEEVFLKDAMDAGHKILFIPECIVATDPDTTGRHFIGNPMLQQTKGAVFRHLYGVCNAVWRSAKEAGHHLLHSGANPFVIFFNMLKGIWMYR